MAKDNKMILSEIETFINENGGEPSNWYTGITSDPKRRLDEHGVKDGWIHCEAASAEAARLIEVYLVEKVGLDGGSGGGDASSLFVYVFKMKSYTTP